MDPYVIREVTDKKEIQKVVEFQDLIWNKKNTTPFPFLIASLHNGGIIIGAFSNEELVGFCYGFPGFDSSEVYLVSHMMAVKQQIRDGGLGYKMKVKQKELALKRGYKKIMWTFDPLESRNAYLNISKLRGIVKTYYPNHYGIMNDELNGGLPSDRFLLEWDLYANSADNIPAEEQIQFCVSWKMVEDMPSPLALEIISNQCDYYKIPVPKDIHMIKERDFVIAEKWRFLLREVFKQLFEKGYFVNSFQTTNKAVNYYIVSFV
ncbi:GNAT family N-acetyltransferase [Niallia sp.]|uniref:GNAT family N-acetyltransferase n=1 Tax=Niallia sp. TaxID=2837523 RepID=UPI00289E26C8|nr:GNAT family N-acetyltransferase [Niallia sp.]